MSNPDLGARVAGLWVAIGALLLVGALVFHGPPSPIMAEQMRIIAEGSLRWSIVHWMAAAALSLFAVAGLIVLTSRSRLTASWATITAWAVLPVGALWTITTSVTEATAIAHIAASGKQELFEPWMQFSNGKANGFAFLAVAVAAIAVEEARDPGGSKPAWVAWIGAVAAIASFVGWVLDSWFGLEFGGPVWLLSSLAMCLWLMWFGFGLARSETRSAATPS